MPDYPDFLATWQVICARAWNDPSFLEQLRDNADEILSSHGFPPPAGMHFAVNVNDRETLNLVVPLSPDVVAEVTPAGNRTISQYQASCV